MEGSNYRLGLVESAKSAAWLAVKSRPGPITNRGPTVKETVNEFFSLSFGAVNSFCT